MTIWNTDFMYHLQELVMSTSNKAKMAVKNKTQMGIMTVEKNKVKYICLYPFLCTV